MGAALPEQTFVARFEPVEELRFQGTGAGAVAAAGAVEAGDAGSVGVVLAGGFCAAATPTANVAVKMLNRNRFMEILLRRKS
jgi:hypothetical protein